MSDELAFPFAWKTRWDLIGYEPPPPEPPPPFEATPCESYGNCHGCLGWCSYCGDVGDMCHVFAWPLRCDTHKRYPPPPPGSDPRQLVLFVE